MINIPNEIKEKIDSYKSNSTLSADICPQIIDTVSSYIDTNITSNFLPNKFLSKLYYDYTDLYCALFDERICHAFLHMKVKIPPTKENYLSIPQAIFEFDSSLYETRNNYIKKFKTYLSSEPFQKLQKHNIIHYDDSCDSPFETKYTIHNRHSDEVIQYLTTLVKNTHTFTTDKATKYINSLNEIKKHSNYPMLINYLYSTDENLPIYLSLTQACQDIIGKNVSEYAKTYQDIIEKKVSEYTQTYQDLIEQDISNAIKKVKEDTLSTISKELTDYLISPILSLSHTSPRIRMESVNETITDYKRIKTLFDIRYAIPLLTVSIDYYLLQLSRTHDTLTFFKLLEEYLYQKEISDYNYNTRDFIKNKSMNTQLNNSILSLISTFCKSRIDHPIIEYIPYVLPPINTSDYFSQADSFFDEAIETCNDFSPIISKSLTADIEKNIIPYICL